MAQRLAKRRKIKWHDEPRPMGAAEIVQELARLDETDDPALPVNWLIRCARGVDWDNEPAYSTAHMRAAVDATIRYAKWAGLIGVCVGIVLGAIIGAALS